MLGQVSYVDFPTKETRWGSRRLWAEVLSAECFSVVGQIWNDKRLIAENSVPGR